MEDQDHIEPVESLDVATAPLTADVIARHPEHLKAKAQKPGSTEYLVQKEAEAARDLLTQLGADAEDADLAADMVEGETTLHEALQCAIDEIRECDVIAAGCKVEIDTLSLRKSRADNRREKIRTAIEHAMVTTGLDTIRLPTKTLSIAHRAGKPVVTEESEIPAEFWTPQRPKLDKTALAKALAERPVPGAHLSNGTVSLTIRSK